MSKIDKVTSLAWDIACKSVPDKQDGDILYDYGDTIWKRFIEVLTVLMSDNLKEYGDKT